jgi:hypothetical protein
MMRHASVTLAALIALAAARMQGQENSILMDGGPSWKGFSILFTPKVEPDRDHASNELGGTVIDLRGGVVGQRFIDDPARKRTFGYDVRLEPSADGRTAQIRIEPLHAVQHAVQNGWTQFGIPAGLPKYPVIPGLYAGDTVALDLLINAATGQKIVDYLTLERQTLPGVAHDFSIADVQLSLDRPRVKVNGDPFESTANFQGTAVGAMVWLYLEGHGRFLLSLLPNEKGGFRKAGTTIGIMLTFRDGGTEFRVDCESAIAPGPGPFNLYVMHEPDWRPRNSSGHVEIGSGFSGAARN